MAKKEATKTGDAPADPGQDESQATPAAEEITVGDETKVVVVKYADYEFELGEPSAQTTILMINALCALGRRSQQHALKVMRNPTAAGVLWGLGEIMTVDDLVRFGSAALRFDDDREGRKWIRNEGARIGPILEAVTVTLAQSTELVDALKNVAGAIDGLGLLGE